MGEFEKPAHLQTYLIIYRSQYACDYTWNAWHLQAEVLPYGEAALSLACSVFQWDPEFMYEWSICKQEGMARKMHCRHNCSLWSFTSCSAVQCIRPILCNVSDFSIAITRTLDYFLPASNSETRLAWVPPENTSLPTHVLNLLSVALSSSVQTRHKAFGICSLTKEMR